MKKVAVFPASGKLGSSVYLHLSRLLPPDRLILICRHPDKVPQDLVKSGVEVRTADYNAPETFKDVFNGVSYLCLISYPSIEIEHRFRVSSTLTTYYLTLLRHVTSNPSV